MHLFQCTHQHAWHLLSVIRITVFVQAAKVDQNVGC